MPLLKVSQIPTLLTTFLENKESKRFFRKLSKNVIILFKIDYSWKNGGDFRLHPKLERIKAAMADFQKTFHEDTCLYLYSQEKVEHALPGKTIDVGFKAGMPIEEVKGTVSYEVLKTGKFMKREVGAEVFGNPYIATAQPIFDGDEVVGVISAVTSIEKVDMLRNGANELGAAVQQMSATSEEMLTAANDIALRLQELSSQSEKIKNEIENIHSILGLVKGIAKQSSILGLNASIEAARSGEHGKGFNVVAKEIRNMAESSNDRVTEIEKQLEVIQNAIEVMNESTQTIATFTEEHNASMQELHATYERIGATSEQLLEASKI